MAVRRVLTNIFGGRKVLAYVTSQEKDSSCRYSVRGRKNHR